MNLSQKLMMRARMTAKELPPVTEAFQGWAPDKPALGNPGATVATNVIPDHDGFRPFPALNVQTGALTARCQGAYAAKDTAGNVQVYAGDASKLYYLASNAWVDASKAGGYTTATDDVWEFVKFGAKAIATNFGDAVQSISLGGTTFSDHITSTNKPRARHIASVLDFVMLGNTYDASDGAVPNRVWWSALNDSTDFDPSAATQADYQDIPEGGWIQKIVGGYQYAVVFMETAIRRFYYVGAPLIFQNDPIEANRGTGIPNSVIAHGRTIFFHSEEGFMVTDGAGSQGIGDGKVDREFRDNFDRSYIARVSAAVDPASKIVLWSYPDSSASGVPNKILLCHWPSQRWASVDIDIELIVRTMQQGYTLDTLDSVSTDLDSLAFSLDSRAWTGGTIKMGAISTLHKLGFFDGSNLAATIETGEFQPNPNGRSKIYSVEPIVDGGTPTVALASRVKQSDAATFGSASTVNSNGKATLISEGRYHRARVTIPAASTWTWAQGVKVSARRAGGK